MSRSCQSATFSRPGLGVAAQEPRDAGDPLADDRVALVRHRRGALLGAGAERLLHLAHLGALEVADLGGEALEAGAGQRDRAQAARRGGRAAPPGWTRPRARGRAARSTAASTSGPFAEYVPTAPDSAPTDTPSTARSSRCRLRSASNANPASLTPKVVGSACTPCVRPTHSVSTCSRARRTSASRQVARARDQDEPRLRQLERQRGVEHVGGGEAVVDPAAGLAHRLGHHVHEGGHVVVGHLLALADRLGGERGPLADQRGVLAAGPRPSRPAPPPPPAPPRARSRACAARTTRDRISGRV